MEIFLKGMIIKMIINILLCTVFFLLGYNAKNLTLYIIIKLKRVDEQLELANEIIEEQERKDRFDRQFNLSQTIR